MEDKVTQKQESQRRFHDNAGNKNAGNKMREFILGQDVLVENLRNSTPKRISGKIIAKTSPLSYKVEIDGVIHRRHVDQMLPSMARVVISDKNAEEDMFLPTPVNNPIAPEPAPEHTVKTGEFIVHPI